MNEKTKSLQKNETWELVECPPEKKSVRCRWIYTVKYKADVVLNDLKQNWMHGVRKAMSEGVQIEEVIVWVEAIPESMVWKFTKSMRAFGYRQIVGNDPEERKALQNYLSREFEMKDLGPLKYFLGIEVSRSSEGIFLSQKISTDKGRYQRLVGRLMYLAHTRPDLAYALSVVSQYMHNPGEQHMNAVMRILRRSTSGYFTFVGGILVTWKSKKQNVVAHSSAEAEFRGMTLGLCEALWLRLLLQDLGYLSKQPIRLFCDNKAACDIAHNPVQHDRIKHVEVDRFFIKEKLDDKIVELPNILSEDQLADILTKAVSSQVF
ncbi:Retrovirus-related Pol polyprotein from transposon RE1 [Vitis vinifera]|uniref:Retrovirus-related Pol polyprotein from transposon RE1 n=1 Tax=Vitis vinifera TaxID=29760 RepID=A0A438CQN5_VITVI|nr:Retrovirus-related Pol polyprotein from transposon RE1 [Vitis vinifera]